jgi:hypothetical protein
VTYHGIFIDDQDDVYAETLSLDNRLKVEFLEVTDVATLAREIVRRGPHLVAIDYRLDETPKNLNPDQTYKGSALAQHLRDSSIERPETDFALVLVSAEKKIKSLYNPDKTAHDLFDRVYIKEDVNRTGDIVRAELVGLCDAYVELRRLEQVYDLFALTRIPDADRQYIDFQELRIALSDAAAPHIVARTFLRNLIDRSGPLLDQYDVAARLGTSVEFLEPVLKALEENGALYRGLLSEPWHRWWAYKVDDWATELFGRRPTGLPASDRAAVLTKKFECNIEPAKSPWNGSPNELVAFACASCRRATEMRHSVAAFEPTLPRFVTRRRICWDCVQTDQFEKAHLKIDDVDAELAEEVKTRPRTADV